MFFSQKKSEIHGAAEDENSREIEAGGGKRKLTPIRKLKTKKNAVSPSENEPVSQGEVV
mgnify:CR=1 FL=1